MFKIPLVVTEISVLIAAFIFACTPPPGTHLVVLAPLTLSSSDSLLFAGNLRDATFLAAYEQKIRVASDSVREQVTDAIRSRLGAEWFCYPGEAGMTHAVFGKYDTLRMSYDAVFHYTVDSVGVVLRSRYLPPLHQLLPRARALHNALALFAPRAQQARINPLLFVQKIAGDTLEVWVLPATDPDGMVLYGSTARYRFDPSGEQCLDSTIVFDRIRGFNPRTTRRITLNNRQRRIPTVGQLFFMLINQPHFIDMRIENRTMLTYYHPEQNALSPWINSAITVPK